MHRLLFFTLSVLFISLALHGGVYAKKKPVEFFEAQKIILERDYVLNDSIEFALFDLSELKLLNGSKEIDLTPDEETEGQDKEKNKTKEKAQSKEGAKAKTAAKDKIKAENSVPQPPPEPLTALDDTLAELANLPAYFYKALDKQILGQGVPVTLYAANSPSYSKPLQLFVKVKRIHLGPSYPSADGISRVQPIDMRIYGQL
ncbi:MAG: hypothetical protein HQM16_03290, partial [Deltaproteobacteria bacterium]|nr:hypothetical protein [Deltaproteobacteria bacterium]